jgi:predicted DNA-binding ribbon-helix-helix protein
MVESGLKKRSVDIDGHRTSVSIEAPFWDALRDLAASKNVSVNQLISLIDKTRAGNLSSAIRVFVLREVSERKVESE